MQHNPLLERASSRLRVFRVYQRAVSYFRPDWPWILLLLALIGVITASQLLTPWPIAVLVDSVLASEPKDDWVHRVFLAILPDGRLGQVIGLALIGLALKVFQDLCTMMRTIVNHRIDYSGLLRVRRDLYRKLQALHLGYHHSRPLGDAIYRLSTDTYGCQAILSVLISTSVAVVTLGSMLFILLSRDVTLTLLALSVTPFLVAANVRFGRTLKACSLEAKETDTHVVSTVQRSIGAIGLVQAFCREKDELKRFHHAVETSIRAWLRFNWQQVVYWLIVGTVFGLGTAAIFSYGGYLVYRNLYVDPQPNGLTIGDLMIFLAYLSMLWDPLCKLTGATASMQSGVAGAERVFEVLDRDPVIQDSSHARPLDREARTLVLDDVTFGYEPDQRVLRGVSATIRPGEMVAFVGPSGVGKSTLFQLLPRFYDPSSGAVRLDDHDLRDVRVKDVRRHVSLALQDTVVLPTTIAENIAYGRPNASLEEIREAAEMAGIRDFIESLPQSYDTPILEGGKNLSGGQRQRISIARAFLSEAPIIMLDEPTSALDPEHEAHITATLRRIKGLRTLIVISHRMKTVRDCDRIYVMDAGRIVESGTHEELMALRGRYWQMVTVGDELREDEERVGTERIVTSRAPRS